MTHDWMVSDVAAVPGVRHALVLSSDGLLTARSNGLDKDEADPLAATCSGLASLAQSVANDHGSGTQAVRQLMVEYDGGFLFVRAAGERSCLAVVTEAVIDPGLIAQQMQAQVLKIGEPTLATPVRRDGVT